MVENFGYYNASKETKLGNNLMEKYSASSQKNTNTINLFIYSNNLLCCISSTTITENNLWSLNTGENTSKKSAC